MKLMDCLMQVREIRLGTFRSAAEILEVWRYVDRGHWREVSSSEQYPF